MKVKALKKFEGIRDAERNVYPKAGDEWETTKERAEFLQSKGVVEILKEEKTNIGETIEKKDWLNKAIKEKIEDEVKSISETMKLIEKEEPKKKTTKKNKKK